MARHIRLTSPGSSRVGKLSKRWVGLAFFGGLTALPGSLFANMMCFCVDCPAGSSIGVPVGIGHAFVLMMPMGGPQNGMTLGYGYYPSYSSPYAPGIVKNDTSHAKDFCICYNVTAAQYNAAAGVINGRIATPGSYSVTGNNCVDFAQAVATAAGITLPTTVNRVGISDPAAAWQSLNGIGNGGTNGGGTVTTSANTPPAGQPKDYSYAGLTNDGHTNPSNLASYTGTQYASTNLGTVNANSITGMSFSFTNANLSNSVVSINWGDGSNYDDQQSSFTHVYSSPGSYSADAFVLDAGAVQSYQFTVNVTSAPGASLSETLASFSPGTGDNTGSAGFQNPVTVAAVPEPAAAMLLAPAGLALLLRRRRVVKEAV